MEKEEVINQIIQERKSVYPNQYIDKDIPDDIINKILENADRAPTHKLTEPWRFRVIKGDAKLAFAQFMGNKYEEITPAEKYQESKREKILNNINRANTIITINFQRDLKNQLPEWEEIAATAMAVQNMYLTCTAYHIGCYWSTPNLIQHMSEFYKMAEGEKCIGIFYMGYYDKSLPISRRKPLSEKVKWI